MSLFKKQASAQNLPPMPNFKPPPLPQDDHDSQEGEVQKSKAFEGLKFRALKRNPSNANIKAIIKWRENLFLAHDDAVRSTRLTELRVSHVIQIFAEDQRKNSCSVQKSLTDSSTGSIKVYINPAKCHPGSLKRLTEMMDQQIGDGVCLIKSKDFNLTGLLTLAYAIHFQKFTCQHAIETLRSKRSDLELNFQVKKLLKEFQNHLDGKDHVKKVGRISKIWQSLVQNWFPITAFIIITLSLLRLACLSVK